MKLFQIGFGLALMILMASSVYAQIGVPHQFYGTVTSNGNPAPAGLLIVAKIDGNDVGGTVTIEGKYGLIPGEIFYVEDPNGDRQGETIEFYVSDILAGEWTFSNGNSTELNLSVTGDICGDGVCTGGESCSSCPVDCGQSQTGNGGNGGNGDGGGYVPPTEPEENVTEAPPEPEECVEDWDCSQWFDCFNDQQRRICVDRNQCGTENDKPEELQECEVPEPTTEISAPGVTETAGEGLTGFLAAYGSWIAGIVIVIVLVIAGLLLAGTRKKKKKVSK